VKHAPRFCLTAVMLSLLPASLAAQVYIVDANNGPGTNFTDLPQAIAAVPDGATLRVRSGKYTPFTVSGKGLTVLAEGTVGWKAGGTVQITGTAPNQLVLLRGFEVPPQGVHVKQARGAVVLERWKLGLFRVATNDVLIEHSANVHVHECDLVTPYPMRASLGRVATGAVVASVQSVVQISRSRLVGVDGRKGMGPRSETGSTGLSLLDSRCLLIASTVAGGRGGPGCVALAACSADGGIGGVGAHVTKSTLIALGSPISGGQGGARDCANPHSCSCPGPGGVGIEITDSTVTIFGATPSGGAAGGTTCAVVPGAQASLKGKNTIWGGPMTQAPEASVEGTQARNQSVALTLRADAGSLAWLMASTNPAITPLDPVIYGSVLSAPQLVLGVFAVPASSKLQIPWKVPSSFPLGVAQFGQFLVLDQTGLWTSNTFPLIVAQ